MAVNKRINAIKEAISVSAQLPDFVGYADYFLHTEASFKLQNAYSETLTVLLRVWDEEKLILPYETELEIPFEGTAEVVAKNLFSPLTLAENDEAFLSTVKFEVVYEKAVVCNGEKQITVLPYDVWEGLCGNAERLAAFVRPRLSDCATVLSSVGKKLKKWDVSSEFYGYVGADKNAVRSVVAAVFSALKQHAAAEDSPVDLSAPVSIARCSSLLKDKRANVLELALFAAAVLESAKLHPVIAIGKNEASVGVWLYDCCFPDPVTDDAETVGKYVAEGINNLAFFDVKDAFEGSNVSFTPSQSHFAQKLKAGYYEYFVDVKRCRLDGVTPLPLRGKSVKGYELIKDEDLSDDRAPDPLYTGGSLSIEGKLPRNRQWERRLLDLTNKNALLNFTGKNALHVCCGDVNALYELFAEKKSLLITGGEEEGLPFGEELREAQRELYAMENRRGAVRVKAEKKQASERAARLMRRNKESAEETGVKILYLAFGFLKYVGKEDGQDRYAPLVLCPVGIKKTRGNEDYSVVYGEEDYFVNTTLLEYLKQAFNIDVRALGGEACKHKISEIINIFRAETASMRGWDVTKDVYVAAFSSQRYSMWNDVRNHFDEFEKNALVSALLTRRAERIEDGAADSEDTAAVEDMLLPLPADSSQYSAVALSRTGKSFVLHGPPGTGKSQTITNIIANALADRKRVLFVAEKRAALDVVKKRLDEIGVGDFCLELHSDKTDKADVVQRIERTLSLKNAEEWKDLNQKANEISELREKLNAPMRALHKKRRLGVSVYEAILLYQKNKSAPDVLNIENAFYDTLTEEKLNECKSKILSAAAAAKECGGVFHSPFENVNVSEYSQELRDRIYCASEVVIAEIRHFRSYLALFLELYRQKISSVTEEKIALLCEIAKNLSEGKYDKYFSVVGEEDFSVFFNASKRLDELQTYYFSHFKTLIELSDAEYQKLSAYLSSGGDYRTDKTAAATFKKLTKCALHPVESGDAYKFLETLAEIYETQRTITGIAVSKNFTDRSGRIVKKKREEFMRDLTDLHVNAAKVFLDYNPDAFNGTCIRAQSGYTMPVLDGFLKASEAFSAAKKSFCQAVCADENKISREDVPDYFYAKASALIDNLDMLANWCMYRKTVAELKKLGCNFIGEALESGKLTGANVLAGFEKNVYQNFLSIHIPTDPDLARCSVGTMEDTVEKFRVAWDEYSSFARSRIRADLIGRLPKAEDGYGNLSVEVSSFTYLAKACLRGTGIRGLFNEVPELMKRVCPCLLMSPSSVAQYLSPEANAFDLVIFDEASQMSTAEAIGSIARAKAAVIVGDPKQLPPTEFFNSAYVDEDHPENEDLESVLDDCLALGMREKHLIWHYRSKHESLIAFSNNAYYENRLCTFPSPDAMDSRVKLVVTDGVYDRGFTKRNQKEAEALVKDVIERLQDSKRCRSSIGVVTFSSAQQNLIEKLLTKEIAAKRLESVAYERDEPLFVKNLENVQGDERDVILFSVCYGPDASGKLSLNFGPLNQSGGWRRLNVAVSRAREEMTVYASMNASAIDLSKTSSKGVAGLKNFLEFAERGKTSLAVKAADARTAVNKGGIGKYIAEELSFYGYECRYDVGASDFKIDVAVVNPKNKHEFILAVLCDANDRFSVKDRNVLQVQSLKRANWNVIRVSSVSYYNNPKREIKRIKEALDKLTGAERKGKGYMRYAKKYRAVAQTGGEVAAFVTSGEHDAEIVARLKEIVLAEEPISRSFLKTRCLATFGIVKSGARIDARLDSLIDACAFKKERAGGIDYYYKNDRTMEKLRFRVENEPCIRRCEEDFTIPETLFLIRCALEEKVSLYFDEMTALVCAVYHVKRPTEQFVQFLRKCVIYGEERGILVVSVSDRIALA